MVITTNRMIAMAYASPNDCAEVSPVVLDPEIFRVRRSIRSCARFTRLGFTPARSSRVVTASRPSTPLSSSMCRNEETFDAWYSAAPVSTVVSVTMRNPSSRLAPTSSRSESNRPACGTARPAMMNARFCASESATRTPNPVVVPSTTTTRFAPPPDIERRSGMMTMAPKKSGPSRAVTQNHLLRTRSTNSRRTTAQTLRIGSRLRPRRLGSDQVQEDLVERGLHQLETGEPGARRDQPLQNDLGIRPRRQLELGILAVVVHALHEPPLGKHLLRGAGAAVEPDDEVVPTACPLDVAERPVNQLLPARDDAQLVAQLFGLFHDVRGEDDRLAAAAQVEHRILHHLRVHGIESRKRLVQDHQLGIVQHGRDELHLLLHPLGQLVNPAQPPVAQPEALEPVLRLGTGDAARHSFHLGEEHEHVEHPHLGVQAALFGQVADARRVIAPRSALTEQPDLALVRLEDVHDHANRRGLPGAVGPEQAEDHAARDRERQAIDCGVTGESLGDAVEGDDGAVHAAGNLPGKGEEGRGRPGYGFMASVSAFQGSNAHLMRTGNLDTPASARRSPRDLSLAADSSPCIIALIRAARVSAWGTVRSLSSCVIIDAEAWLIEHPRPMNPTSRITSESTRNCRSISSPHSGLLSETECVAPSSAPLLRGRR